ncbi:lipoyl(octanoyl) transferase LipB [Geomonas anaerohicana]|uniref:Octanoyltransferase n=1 Tax=Geomonas anaerohicana TaxID=2798583 RepID=A0ABS0YF51_9BACT|nr:lipoyl(octanoyl) transferase LipB [Geomonas anaerohicana]MBJ6750906.1 lipoyl(octanoyl) transferase LipB [Geomonas anaerohicana]
MVVRDVGLIEYREALALQESLVHEVQQGGAETLLLLEHHPVYTIGAGGNSGNVLDPGIEAHRVNRGGDVTYHGPGQLVGYPILDLGRRGRDLHRYLRFLELFLVELCGSLDVAGFTVPGKTGVWTAAGKIAAIGVGVRHWVSMHGFSLNVAADVSAFGNINPCGMPECRITSLTLERRQEITVKELKALAGERFAALLESHLPRS